jgi:putative two-component system response regulator
MASVLIIEDDPDITAVLEIILESEGYTVHAAVDGAALQVAVAQQPDVILLDIQMPGMDGIEVARRLRADERTRHIPIALMSAAHRLRERAHEAPVDTLLSKPFDLAHVLEVVEHLAGGATEH